MRTLLKSVFFGVTSLGLASAVHAGYGPGSPATVTAVPPGYTACAADNKVCKVPAGGGAVSVVWGVGNRFVTAQGSGDFTCLPKGWVKFPSASTPADLGVDDPAPGAAKTCYIKTAAAAPAPAAQPAAAPAAGGLVTSVPGGAVACATDGKRCDMSGAWTGVYGAGNRYATISGTGSFTCLPKGYVNAPSAATPPDTGVADPAPGVLKTCHVVGTRATATAAAPAPAPQPAAAPAAGGLVTSVPGGAVVCATDGKRCDMSGAWTGVYGAAGKYATISGNGPFTCLPKGYVKAPSAATPADTGVADPAPGVAKTCHVVGTIVAAAPAPVQQPAAAPAGGTLVAGCNAYKGTVYNAVPKNYASTAALNANYQRYQGMLTQAANAPTECAKLCGMQGEPAPCAWFSVTQWLQTNTATGRDTMSFGCHMFSDRNLKHISTPVLPMGTNLGSPSMPLRFQGARTYACRI